MRRNLIVELLDHNEFGVAFEMIREQLIEHQRRIPEARVDSLVEVARLMDIEPDEAELRSLSA